jgi:heme exporter protein A
MLHATDLACSRGERRLFEGLEFKLQPGEWLHVKGDNGSGKTTLLRTLIGLSPPDAGAIRWRGDAIADRADDYRRALVYLGHQAGLKEELTPVENLRLALALDGFEANEAELVNALRWMGLKAASISQRATCRPGRNDVCCWPGCCCGRPSCGCSTNRSAPSTPPRSSCSAR